MRFVQWLSAFLLLSSTACRSPSSATAERSDASSGGFWPSLAKPSSRGRPDGADARASCARERGGCVQEAALPACPEGVEITWPKKTWWKTAAGPATPEPGSVVVAQGQLHRYDEVCSAAFCPPDNPCCNQCVASVALRANGYFITLSVRGRDVACRGDESIICCDVETHDQTVIVRGTVLAADGAKKTARLDNVEMCEPAAR